MNFKIDNALPPIANSALDLCIKILRDLPDGELLSVRGLAAKVKKSVAHVSGFSAIIPVELSVLAPPNRKLYGNSKTIAAWKKQKVQAGRQ